MAPPKRGGGAESPVPRETWWAPGKADFCSYHFSSEKLLWLCELPKERRRSPQREAKEAAAASGREQDPCIS